MIDRVDVYIVSVAFIWGAKILSGGLEDVARAIKEAVFDIILALRDHKPK